MLQEEKDLTFTFEQDETKPIHLLSIPKGWWCIEVLNVRKVANSKPLTYEGLAPEFKNKYSEQVMFICRIAKPELQLPPIDPNIKAQWEAQGYTVEWQNEIFDSFPVSLVDKDDNDNVISRIPDTRKSFKQQGNTMRMVTYADWRKIGVPYGELPIIDPVTGQQRLVTQFNTAAFKGEYYMIEVGEPKVVGDTVYTNIVGRTSLKQYELSNTSPTVQPVQAAQPTPQLTVPTPTVQVPTTQSPSAGLFDKILRK